MILSGNLGTSILVSIDNGKTWGNAPVFLRLTSAILLSDKRRHGRLFPKASRVPQGDAIPHEVVGLTVKKGYTLVRAWQEYLMLTQAEVAERRGDRDFALIPGFAH